MAVPKEQLPDSGDLPWKSWRTANQVRCGKLLHHQQNWHGATLIQTCVSVAIDRVTWHTSWPHVNTTAPDRTQKTFVARRICSRLGLEGWWIRYDDDHALQPWWYVRAVQPSGIWFIAFEALKFMRRKMLDCFWKINLCSGKIWRISGTVCAPKEAKRHCCICEFVMEISCRWMLSF